MISPTSSTMFLMCRLPIQRTGLVDAPFWRHHEGRDRQFHLLIGQKLYSRILCHTPSLPTAPFHIGYRNLKARTCSAKCCETRTRQVRFGSRLCENVRKPRRHRNIFSIAFSRHEPSAQLISEINET